jgi:hypothetical protein
MLFFIPLLILLHFYERLIFLDSIGSRISIADFTLLLMAFYTILISNFRLVGVVYVLSIYSFLMIVLSSLINNISLVNTALLSVPSRFLIAGFVFYALLRRPLCDFLLKLYLILFMLLVIFLIILFSGSFAVFESIDFINRNEAGIFLIIALIFWLILFSPSFLLIYALIFSLLLFFIIIGSRQLIISLILPYIFYHLISFFGNGSLCKKLLYLFLMATSLISLALFISFFATDEYGMRRFYFIFDADLLTSSDNLRLGNYFFVLQNFSNSIFFGHGLGSFYIDRGEGVVAHSGFLTTLYEFGIIGLVFLLFIFYIIALPLVKLLKADADDKLLLVSCLLLGVFFQLFFIELYSKLAIPICVGVALYLNWRIKVRSAIKIN